MRSWMIIAALLFAPLMTQADEVKCDGPHKGKTYNNISIQTAVERRDNLCGTNLKGIDLSKQQLDKMNFAGSDLSEANLQGTQLKFANLFKTYFRGSIMDTASFYGANLIGSSFEYSKINNADFQQANLKDANLSFSSAENASFRGADLHDANLSNMNLTNADLSYANLSNANLSESNLTGANLNHAKLIATNLAQANLTNTSYLEANLTEAQMISVSMNDTNFNGTNLKNAIFQPKFGTLPDLIALSHSNNFNTVHFDDFKEGTASLNVLRREYKLINMRGMERVVTAIIKQEQMFNAWHRGGWGYFEAAFSYVMFYITCDFGAAPGRPLLLLIIMVFLLSIAYRFALTFPTRHSAIMVTWKPKRFFHWNKVKQWSENGRLCMVLKKRQVDGIVNKIKHQQHLMLQAIFFSFLSAFKIGWRDLNINNFLSRMQKRDYILIGTGWVRVLSGMQSIISIYLVVLWILTYFGRPFEW